MRGTDRSACAISSQRAAIPGRPWAGPTSLWLRAASNDTKYASVVSTR